MKKVSLRRIILSSLLGVLLAIFTPSAMCAPIALVALYAYSGIIPAGVMYVTMLSMIGGMLDMGGILFVFAVIGIPSAVVAIAMEKQMPFFKQLKLSLAVFGVCTAGYAILYNIVCGQSVVSLLTGSLTAYLDGYTGEEAQALLSIMGYTEAFDAQNAKSILTGYFGEVESILNQNLPQYIIVYAGVNALISTQTINRVRKKRGDERANHVPLAEWHLPVNTVIALAATLLIAYILYQSRVNNADYALSVVMSICVMACTVQAAGSIMRRFAAGGMSMRACSIIAGLAILLPGNIMFIYGAASALFGRFGAVTQFLREYKEKHGNGDDRL